MTLPRVEIGFLLGTRLAVLAIALVSQFVLAHLLLAEGRGIYAICVLLGTLSGVMFTPGSDRGAQYFVMSGRMTLSEGLSCAYYICILGTIIASAFFFGLMQSGLGLIESAPAQTFYLAFLLVPVLTISRTTIRQIASMKRFGRLAAYTLIQAAATLLATLFFVWGLDLGVDGAIAALGAGHVLTTALAFFFMARTHGVSLRIPGSESLVPMLRYGARDWVSTVGLAAEASVVALVLGLIATPAEVGLVVLAAAIVTRVLLVPDAMTTYLVPRVAGNPAGASGLSASFSRTALWAAAILMLGWAAVSGVAVDLLLPAEFAPVERLSWIMAAGVCAAAVSEILMGHFRASGSPEVVSWSVWAGLTSTACLTFALYSLYGLNGAAWAVTGGYLVRGALLVAAFSRRERVSPLDLLLFRHSDIAGIRSVTLGALPGRRQA